MPTLAARFLSSAMVLAGLHPAAGLACASIPPERQAEVQARRVEAFKADVAAIRDEADLVFVGYLSTLKSADAADPSAPGLRTHQAVFMVHEQIKGAYRDGQLLEYSTDRNRVVVGCGPAFRLLPKENGEGERYLVYAKEGKIIRTNHIPSDAQALSGNEEAAFLREQ